MGTLTALMNLSREALQADQTALNVTSSNVANQNTVGYTRQVVSWQTTDVVTLTGTTEGVAAADAGAGAEWGGSRGAGAGAEYFWDLIVVDFGGDDGAGVGDRLVLWDVCGAGRERFGYSYAAECAGVGEYVGGDV